MRLASFIVVETEEARGRRVNGTGGAAKITSIEGVSESDRACRRFRSLSRLSRHRNRSKQTATKISSVIDMEGSAMIVDWTNSFVSVR